MWVDMHSWDAVNRMSNCICFDTPAWRAWRTCHQAQADVSLWPIWPDNQPPALGPSAALRNYISPLSAGFWALSLLCATFFAFHVPCQFCLGIPDSVLWHNIRIRSVLFWPCLIRNFGSWCLGLGVWSSNDASKCCWHLQEKQTILISWDKIMPCQHNTSGTSTTCPSGAELGMNGTALWTTCLGWAAMYAMLVFDCSWDGIWVCHESMV